MQCPVRKRATHMHGQASLHAARLAGAHEPNPSIQQGQIHRMVAQQAPGPGGGGSARQGIGERPAHASQCQLIGRRGREWGEHEYAPCSRERMQAHVSFDRLCIMERVRAFGPVAELTACTLFNDSRIHAAGAASASRSPWDFVLQRGRLLSVRGSSWGRRPPAPTDRQCQAALCVATCMCV